MALKIFQIFCMDLEGNGAHCLSQVAFWKDSESFFVALIFRYKTEIFQRKEKLHIDLKKKK